MQARDAHGEDYVDYEIIGDDLQRVEVALDPNETAVAKVGGESARARRFGAGKHMIAGHVAWLHLVAASGE